MLQFYRSGRKAALNVSKALQWVWGKGESWGGRECSESMREIKKKMQKKLWLLHISPLSHVPLFVSCSLFPIFFIHPSSVGTFYLAIPVLTGHNSKFVLIVQVLGFAWNDTCIDHWRQQTLSWILCQECKRKKKFTVHLLTAQPHEPRGFIVSRCDRKDGQQCHPTW